MRKATKLYKILDLYKKNPDMPVENICALANSSEQYVKTVIADYHAQNVSYYELCLAPSLAENNTYYLFSDNGSEKTFKVYGKIVFTDDDLTLLEKFYITTNLGLSQFAKFSNSLYRSIIKDNK
jgi:hypothetical protein